MTTVTESIYTSDTVVVALADVQHVERIPHGKEPRPIYVITKHTTWSQEIDNWANAIYIRGTEASSFLSAWCRYRAELESATLANLGGES